MRGSRARTDANGYQALGLPYDRDLMISWRACHILHRYEAQDFLDWRLFVSDDGSQDGTMVLLEEFQRKHGPAKVSLRRGP